jgi:hypothetical protein
VFFVRSELIALVIVAIFLASFFLFTSIKPREYFVGDLKIISEKQPKEALQQILSKKTILIQMNLTNSSSAENSAVGKAGAEIAGVLGFYNKSVLTYGVVDGRKEINCNANTSYCSGASIVVAIGECNCLKIESDRINFVGTVQYLQSNAVTVRRIFDGLLGELETT